MKNYCPELFKRIYVEKVNETQIRLGHCCLSQFSEPTDKITFDHEFLVKNRQHFLSTQELPAACETCITIEAQGGFSRRMNSVAAQNDNNLSPFLLELRNLDYNCDMVCNLKCIICSSHYSSSWLEDDYKLGKITSLQIRKTKNNQAIDLIDLSKLTQVYFNGGEPLMTNDHINLLTKIIESGNPSVTDVTYNTNATFPLTDKFLSIWEKFKSVTLFCSVDAIDEVFEYVRFPGNWASIEKNIADYSNTSLLNLELTISPTVGLHNVLYMHDLHNWAVQNNYQFNIQGDSHGALSIKNFPIHLQGRLIEYVNQLPVGHMKERLLSITRELHNSDDVNYWIEYLNQLDSIRGNSWRKSLSRLYELDPIYFDAQ